MASLHIVRQSAYHTSDFSQCVQILGNKDVIVFIDDGCYNLQHSLINSIESSKNVQFKVVTSHASARAININEDIFEKITMEDLVSLTFENDRVITWQ
jgi:tRNA 2-thiouridine synthesizing protein B